MRNCVGIYTLFGDNEKSKELFINWCEHNEEFCEFDIDRIASDLYLPATDNSEMYFHFHRGNLLDFLEEQGYFIQLEVSLQFNYSATVYTKIEGIRMPIFFNGFYEDRNKHYEKAVSAAINHLEEKL